MNGSILTDIKEMLGILEGDTGFDGELISHINAAFSTLTDIAIGPSEGYMIEDKSNTWDEVSDVKDVVSACKQYIFSYVRLLFDPPSNSFVCDALSKNKDELYWRLYMKVNKVPEEKYV